MTEEPAAEDEGESRADPRAGYSANAEAERLHQLARDQQALADHTRAQADNWAKGAEGERRTASALAALPPPYVVLHDLHVPGSKANVDHLVIGPTGVVVVDSKAHSGTYTAGAGTLWRGRYPLRHEADTLEFIGERLAEHLDVPVVGILCFTEAELPQPVNELGSVRAVSIDALCSAITDAPTVHTEEMVKWLERLALELEEPTQRRAPAPKVRAKPRVRPRSSPPSSLPPQGRPTRSGTKQQTAGRSGSRRRSGRNKPGCLSIIVLMFAILFLLWIAAAALQQAAEKVIPSTTTTLPPTVGMAFSCPAPGAGYTGTFTYPTTGPNFGSYLIVVTFGDLELHRDRWSNRYIEPPPMTGLFPGAELVVTTTKATDPGSSGSQSFTTPAEPC